MSFSSGGRSQRNIFASNITDTFIGSESSVFIAATFSFTTLELSTFVSGIEGGNIEQSNSNQDVYYITYTITAYDNDKIFQVNLPDTSNLNNGYKLTIINSLSRKLKVNTYNETDQISSWTLMGTPANREETNDGTFIELPPYMAIDLTYAENRWYSSI